MIKTFIILKAKFKTASVAFVALHAVFAALFLLLRVVEIILETAAHDLPKEIIKVLSMAMVNDIAFILTGGFWLFVVFFILFCFNKKSARLFYVVTAVLLCIIQLGLANYFVTTLVPLGADLWTYSIADIKQTLGASGITPGMIAGLIIAITLFILSFKRLPQKIVTGYKYAGLVIFTMMLAQLFHVGSVASKLKTKTEQGNNLVINKSYFFYGETYQKIFPEEHDLDIYADSYINDFGEDANNALAAFQYVDAVRFPFLHKDNTADVLSSFFKKSATPPNIVIILTEGLGRAFTNRGAYLGNFTPFIDSLSQKSLYWENFLSEGGRTFAALPSLLGSLPFSKNGFLELADKSPDNLNLINILDNNGYRSDFYYGGNSHFDYMDVFLKRSGISSVSDINSFPQGYIKMPTSTSGFTWGYGDKELFRYYLAKNNNFTKPSLQVLLTVSTHNPFLINEQDTYLKKFEERMQQLDFDETTKAAYRNYKQQYASILYTDDAFKLFFENYAKRPDFNNTVFIITGDHRMPEIPMSTKIDRYHVPLIIYSALLNRSANFSSVSTHFDIAPTLLAWLKNQYHISLPTLSSWMGSGIDTSHSFRNIHNYPMMQTKNGVNGFLMGDYFLDGDDAFELGNNMSLVPLEDEVIKSRIKAAFESFKQNNDKVVEGMKMLPDSILLKYKK